VPFVPTAFWGSVSVSGISQEKLQSRTKLQTSFGYSSLSTRYRHSDSLFFRLTSEGTPWIMDMAYSRFWISGWSFGVCTSRALLGAEGI